MGPAILTRCLRSTIKPMIQQEEMEIIVQLSLRDPESLRLTVSGTGQFRNSATPHLTTPSRASGLATARIDESTVGKAMQGPKAHPGTRSRPVRSLLANRCQARPAPAEVRQDLLAELAAPCRFLPIFAAVSFAPGCPSGMSSVFLASRAMRLLIKTTENMTMNAILCFCVAVFWKAQKEE